MHENTPSNAETAASTKRRRAAIQQNELDNVYNVAGASKVPGQAIGFAKAENRPVCHGCSAIDAALATPSRPIDER